MGRSLSSLHWIGLGCGLVFLLTCVLMAMAQGGAPIFHARDLLLFAMMGITLYLHFGLERRMLKLRDSMGVIDNVPVTDARRVEFNHMHEWSTRLEGSVFFLGLGCCTWWCGSRRLARGDIRPSNSAHALRLIRRD